jgi:hypothetical protein
MSRINKPVVGAIVGAAAGSTFLEPTGMQVRPTLGERATYGAIGALLGGFAGYALGKFLDAEDDAPKGEPQK